jgi:hypothetical protein
MSHGEPVGHMLDDMCFFAAIALGGNSIILPFLVGLETIWAIGGGAVAVVLFLIGLKINTKESFWAWVTWQPKAGGGIHL